MAVFNGKHYANPNVAKMHEKASSGSIKTSNPKDPDTQKAAGGEEKSGKAHTVAIHKAGGKFHTASFHEGGVTHQEHGSFDEASNHAKGQMENDGEQQQQPAMQGGENQWMGGY